MPRYDTDEWWDTALEPKPYVAANLYEALKLVPDTGDWHGQLRGWCQHYMKHPDRPSRPNATAGEQVERVRALCDALSDESERP